MTLTYQQIIVAIPVLRAVPWLKNAPAVNLALEKNLMALEASEKAFVAARKKAFKATFDADTAKEDDPRMPKYRAEIEALVDSTVEVDIKTMKVADLKLDAKDGNTVPRGTLATLSFMLEDLT